MTNKRKRGRPLGSRNKLSASDEIKKALSQGKGLIEFKEFLWAQLMDDKVTELQKAKFSTMYADIIKFIHVQGIALEDADNEQVDTKVGIEKGEHTADNPKKENQEDSGTVYKMKFGGKS